MKPHSYYLDLAIDEARRFIGATAPNPPVGSVAINANGDVLSVQAHHRAGDLHAEARVIADLKEKGILSLAHRLYVTLEPCNHTGKTPPCAKAILETPIREVYLGAADPNPVASGGANFLSSSGIAVHWVKERSEAASRLIQPFSKWVNSKVPYIIVKTAHRRGMPPTLTAASMVPPKGMKTFTSEDSLKQVHLLRRESDAIFTSNKTVIADAPELTVRHVKDHEEKQRFLSIFTRFGHVDATYLAQAAARGFQVRVGRSIKEELWFLGRQGVHQILVEAGPEFSAAVLETPFWDEHRMFHQGSTPEEPDTLTIVTRP